ncbi:MAG: hypothetical protein U5R46_03830 [Gammaproteobacteria bacterium]|nr:hypothetical protein [Gammaproteobacteria bacterium]
MTIPPRILVPLLLALTLILSSCGSGTTTVGSGDSGIGGTGITTVTGNVSQIIADGPDAEQAMVRRMIAGVMNWVAQPVNAQLTFLGGIQVFGGGQLTTTDDNGNFVLEDVSPSDNFVLSFVFEDEKTVALPIGTVPAGARVSVNDIVVDMEQGFATPGNIEVEENFPGSGQGGNPPGLDGNPPGQSGDPPGQSGNASGNDDS